MQYENVFKVIGGVHVILCLPRTALAAAQTAQKMEAAPGTSTGAPPMDQRLLMNTWPKARHNNKHTSKH